MQKIFLLGIPNNKLLEDFELIERKLTPGRWYMGSLTPTIYDPNTLQPADPSYVVTCDDGKARKVDAKYFITLEEWRESQFNRFMIVRPEDLPNLQTVEEIFIELEDTKRYSISYKPILNKFKESNEYNLGFKLINFCEVDSDSIRPYAICDFDSAVPSTIKIKENKYKLHRYVMRIDIDVKPDVKVHPITIDNELNEIVERLKTYLGNDFINFNKSGINRHYIGVILNEVVKL